jgi:hypothetical protein
MKRMRNNRSRDQDDNRCNHFMLLLNGAITGTLAVLLSILPSPFLEQAESAGTPLYPSGNFYKKS